MKMKQIGYIIYLVVSVILYLLDNYQMIQINPYVNTAIGILLAATLFTRLPLPSHSLTLPKQTEALAKEQAKQPFISLSAFFALLIPLLILSAATMK